MSSTKNKKRLTLIELEITRPLNSHVINFYINEIVKLAVKIEKEESLRPIQDNMFGFNHTKVRVRTPYTTRIESGSVTK